MNDKKRLSEQMDIRVHQFKEEFNMTFGITPFVSVNIKQPDCALLSMGALKKILDKFLYVATAHRFDNIFVKSCDRRVTLHRQLFVKIAMDLGYTLTEVTKRTGLHHSTVIYSNKMITDLMDTNNLKVKALYDNVTYQISIYHSNTLKEA